MSLPFRRPAVVMAFALAFAVTGLAACGGGGSPAGPNPNPGATPVPAPGAPPTPDPRVGLDRGDTRLTSPRRRARRPRPEVDAQGAYPQPRRAGRCRRHPEKREQRDLRLDQSAGVHGERPEHGVQHLQRRGVSPRQQPALPFEVEHRAPGHVQRPGVDRRDRLQRPRVRRGVATLETPNVRPRLKVMTTLAAFLLPHPRGPHPATVPRGTRISWISRTRNPGHRPPHGRSGLQVVAHPHILQADHQAKEGPDPAFDWRSRLRLRRG